MPLDPDAQRVVDLIALAGSPPLSALAPPAARLQYRNTRRVMQNPPADVAAVLDLDADGIALRLYEGLDAAAGPCLVFLHGGGWVIGGIESHDGVCRQLANAAKCRVISVEYRLAPEHPFPAPVDDAAASFRWVVAHAHALGVDPARIAVGGDSAGGNLAAVLALMGRDGAIPPPCFQVLLYPATDLGCATASYARYKSGVTLTADTMLWFRDQYIGTGGDPADWRISPLRANLAGVAPAFVLTAGYDPLCDEGMAYAAALDAAGVPMTHLHMPTQMHGFLTMGRVIKAADTALDMTGAILRHAWQQRQLQ